MCFNSIFIINGFNMSSKKYIIERSFNKMRALIESRVIEQSSTQTSSSTTNQALSDPNRDQKISANIDATMDQAMSALVSSLPTMLANFAKNSGDKDGVIEVPGVYDGDKSQEQSIQDKSSQSQTIQEMTFDEGKFSKCMGEQISEGGLIGLVASAPAIIKYGGKAVEWTGKKMNSGWLSKWGNKTAQAGENLHHKYISVIERAIKPFMPNATPEQLHKAADGIFMSGVAILFAGGLADPGMLTGVKGTELGQKAISILGKVMPTIGFA